MTEREFFVTTIEDELPRFERVFDALPADKLNWRPHERSKSAIELADNMGFEAKTYPLFLKTGVLDFSKVQPPGSRTINAAGSIFRSALVEAKDIASGMTEADWKAPAKMIADGSTEWETTRGGMAWSLLFDLIHHRGQLSVYIRPMGGKVPSIYGPSGDNPSA